MRFDWIEAVKFKKLDENKSDRRGTIAVFYLKKVANQEFVEAMALRFLWRIISLLSSHYHPCETVDEIYRGEEKNECWVFHDNYEDYQVRVVHKYWSEKQTKCFCEIIESLAVVHQWKVIKP